MGTVAQLWNDINGADATEYALLGALVALVIIGSVSTLGLTLSRSIMSVSASIPTIIAP